MASPRCAGYGSALLNATNGVKDLDVFTFAEDPARGYPNRRRDVEVFGDSEHGRHPDDHEFVGLAGGPSGMHSESAGVRGAGLGGAQLPTRGRDLHRQRAVQEGSGGDRPRSAVRSVRLARAVSGSRSPNTLWVAKATVRLMRRYEGHMSGAGGITLSACTFGVAVGDVAKS